jgi:hypothetical protein
MIILGQSGYSEALPVFLNQIKDPNQPALVKLWAFRGISNLKKPGRAVLPANIEINAAKGIAEELDNDKGLPWPAQLRGLEALGDLRHGHTATSPKNLEMASVAMKFLNDPKAKPEIRAEAARALGLMQISAVVTDYNYDAIATTAGEVAAELGELVAKSHEDNPNRSEYYASFILGPILEAFEGVQGVRDGGGLLSHASTKTREKFQEIDNRIRDIAKASVELIRGGRSQYATLRSELASKSASLKEYLQKNSPKDRSLIPGA